MFEYIEKLDAQKQTVADIDYVIKAVYPLKYEILEQLLDVEQSNPSVLENTYLEFEDISLSGRQLVNFCNNLNINILVKTMSDEQMEQLLTEYTNVNVRKTIYPAKIIVLASLAILYGAFFLGKEVPNDIASAVKEYLDMIKFDYIDGKYSIEFLVKWVQWYLKFLCEEKKTFLDNFVPHCYYLFEEAQAHFNKTPLVRSKTTELTSGLYVPLAFVMNDFKFNPYKRPMKPTNFKYVNPDNMKYVVMALSPVAYYSKLVDDYLATSNKEAISVEKLDDMDKDEIVTALRLKKKIVTKDATSKFDLFPLEIECLQS
jgi:hypothetical protein